MHRCFAEPSCWRGSEVVLPPDESHHLLDVLRAGEGDEVRVVDGQGREAVARVAAGPRGRASLRVVTVSRVPKRPVAVTLFQAVLKGSAMDTVVEKAVELGAEAVVPVLCERVVTRAGADRLGRRAGRWRRIARSAAKQCGAAWLTEVCPAVRFAQALTGAGAFDLLLIGSLDGSTRPFHAALDDVRGTAIRTAGLLIGPEGDFTAAERSRAADAGAIPVRFGPLTLRAETAALYGLSVLAYELNASPSAAARQA